MKSRLLLAFMLCTTMIYSQRNQEPNILSFGEIMLVTGLLTIGMPGSEALPNNKMKVLLTTTEDPPLPLLIPAAQPKQS